MLRDQQNKREWKRFLEADELEGKTVGIVGVGEIGKVIARKCKLLGMEVLGSGPRPVQNEYLDRFYLTQDLPSMLAQTDFLILVCPLTASTRGMIGEKELQAMKSSAFLFNLARGPVVNHQALLKALKEGWIAGAGLDALDPEPLPPESELWDLPNVIISPHMSAISPYYMQRAAKVFAENLGPLRPGRAFALSLRLGQRILSSRQKNVNGTASAFSPSIAGFLTGRCFLLANASFSR